MKTKTHMYKLQKSSGFYLPLGLVLTLLMVYALLESKSAIAATIPNSDQFEREDPYEFPTEIEVQIERSKTVESKKEVTKPQIELADLIVSIDNSEKPEIEDYIIVTDEVNPKDSSIEFAEVNQPEKLDDDADLIMDLVDEIPIYPGCEKGNKTDKRACFEKKLKRLVQKKFNGDLVNTLGLSPGKKKIFVKFVITKSGVIEISDSRAPHIELKKEGERIVRSIPRMTPGKQNGREVNVTYMLPITFKVE